MAEAHHTPAEGDHEAHEDLGDRYIENDEVDWELDDAASEPAGSECPPSDSNRQAGIEEIVNSFVIQHPPPKVAATSGQLPCPVILPQRRPRNKSRGFVRAYAPVLSDCGIDQATFLDFLNSFERASEVCLSASYRGSSPKSFMLMGIYLPQVSPIFHVMNAAAFGLGFVPSVAAQTTAIALNVSVKVGEEVQMRKRLLYPFLYYIPSTTNSNLALLHAEPTLSSTK